ncbi:UNVERIFIED_CONTAM: protein YIF1B [Sesamum calycinum]|uniref:Protein YIF1B n=1 Tax=Sesamum calycinum TaxID=2727403 RepID=A0AAW2N5J9_9LAMI
MPDLAATEQQIWPQGKPDLSAGKGWRNGVAMGEEEGGGGGTVLTMHETSHPQARFFVPVSCNQSDQLGNVLNYVAGSDLIRSELGAYGEKILGSGSEYVQSSISRYISNPRYYFQVNDDYVKNKLKVVLFPFLHKGHWMRTVEPAGGKFSFKPPIHDINAPDLYIPMMAFGTYVLLAGFFLGINGKSYTFVGAAVIVAVRLLADYLFCVATLWESLCMGVLLVKTMKRILISEVQSFEKNSTKRNYILLFTAAAQIPLLFWLGSVSVETH